MEIEIRDARPTDADAVLVLLDGLGYRNDPTAVRERLERFAASPRDHVLVAEAERIATASGSTFMQVNCGRRPERERAHRFYVSLGHGDQHAHHVLYDKVLLPGR